MFVTTVCFDFFLVTVRLFCVCFVFCFCLFVCLCVCVCVCVCVCMRVFRSFFVFTVFVVVFVTSHL